MSEEGDALVGYVQARYKRQPTLSEVTCYYGKKFRKFEGEEFEWYSDSEFWPRLRKRYFLVSILQMAGGVFVVPRPAR